MILHYDVLFTTSCSSIVLLLGQPHFLKSLRIFFFHDTATTEIYPLSLHDALPISATQATTAAWARRRARSRPWRRAGCGRRRSDRKSTRLNSSHANRSYAVFCLKKKKQFRFYFVKIDTQQ